MAKRAALRVPGQRYSLPADGRLDSLEEVVEAYVDCVLQPLTNKKYVDPQWRAELRRHIALAAARARVKAAAATPTYASS